MMMTNPLNVKMSVVRCVSSKSIMANMTFDEFLMNSNRVLYDTIRKAYLERRPLDAEIHNLAMEQVYRYLLIGGMPEAVQSFAESKDFQEVRDIQKRILTAYEQDFSKHAPNEIVPRLRMLWNSIPSQLSKENKKIKLTSF